MERTISSDLLARVALHEFALSYITGESMRRCLMVGNALPRCFKALLLTFEKKDMMQPRPDLLDELIARLSTHEALLVNIIGGQMAMLPCDQSAIFKEHFIARLHDPVFPTGAADSTQEQVEGWIDDKCVEFGRTLLDKATAKETFFRNRLPQNDVHPGSIGSI